MKLSEEIAAICIPIDEEWPEKTKAKAMRRRERCIPLIDKEFVPIREALKFYLKQSDRGTVARAGLDRLGEEISNY